ncbi:hypothetical protein WKI68_09555 [Streptomyces sp. MS1.HAVA.3]|uniref:Uncharacterized protein n=1 Tax=Streptomyces caledonius TaxID=3134107 RepID=A0ABU8U1C7_9ACTN
MQTRRGSLIQDRFPDLVAAVKQPSAGSKSAFEAPQTGQNQL